MNQQTIKKEVFNILQDMGIAQKAITLKASLCKDLGLDSLDFTELVMEFEHRFNVEIPTLEAENIQTVEQAIKCLGGILKK